ncbi:hypothetical protein K8I31_03775, partial [bacterium]|nr:hypothetical protein [bacterium]
MNVYAEILNWSKNIPEWQRDALRRLVEKNSLDEIDQKELLLLCTGYYGVPNDEERIDFRPLSEDHLPDLSSIEKHVELKKIEEVKNVSAIKDNSPALCLNPKGLVAIYGNNGAGKSSYVRILKRACRIRGAVPEIIGNVYEESSSIKPSANIHYLINNEEKTFNWEDGKTPPIDLSNILVFDSDCATAYIEQKNDIAFLPFGLDVFPKLANVASQICEKIDSKITALENKKLRNDDIQIGTKVGNFVRAITKKITVEQINQHCVWDEEDDQMLKKL